MHRVADLHAGEAKMDARDATEAALTLPHTLRTLKPTDTQIAGSPCSAVNAKIAGGFDDDLATQTTQACNRIRGLLTLKHPALEHVLDLSPQYPRPKNLLL